MSERGLTNKLESEGLEQALERMDKDAEVPTVGTETTQGMVVQVQQTLLRMFQFATIKKKLMAKMNHCKCVGV